MSRRLTNPVMCMLLAAVLVVLAGCGAFPGSERVTDVPAQYLGLSDQSVAVVVATRSPTAFNFPTARPVLTREITRRVVANVPGTTVTDPEQVLAWQDANPYWATQTPSMMIRQLDVDRLVIVEIGDYRTHDPGDRHILRGVITATVNIVEADADDPDNYGGSYSITAMYPEPNESIVGRADIDGVAEERVELMTQIRFCDQTAGLFFDHQIVR